MFGTELRTSWPVWVGAPSRVDQQWGRGSCQPEVDHPCPQGAPLLRGVPRQPGEEGPLFSPSDVPNVCATCQNNVRNIDDEFETHISYTRVFQHPLQYITIHKYSIVAKNVHKHVQFLVGHHLYVSCLVARSSFPQIPMKVKAQTASSLLNLLSIMFVMTCPNHGRAIGR